MTHRAGGGLVLLLAVLSLLVVPRVLNPPEVSGAARIEPPEPPPAVGTCLADVPDGYRIESDGHLYTDRHPTTISCNEEHDGEIVYLVDDVDPGQQGYIGPGIDEVLTQCWESSDGLWPHLGTQTPDPDQFEPGRWWSVPEMTTTLIGPDPTQLAHGARWVACVAGLPDSTLRVPLAGIVARSGGIPPELSSCIRSVPDTSGPRAGRVPCAAPHRAETMASALLGDGTPSIDELTSGCKDVATKATRREGLSTESGLDVEVYFYTWLDTGLVVTTGELPAPAPTGGAWAECLITVTDPDRRLTGSLRLLGDAPLPWA